MTSSTWEILLSIAVATVAVECDDFGEELGVHNFVLGIWVLLKMLKVKQVDLLLNMGGRKPLIQKIVGKLC